MIKLLFRLRKAKNQRGAMFSMDARIALIIASVLAGVVGTQVIQRIERNRVAAAEEGVQQLLEGLKNYYTTVSLDAIPPGGTTNAFNTGAGNFESVIIDTGLVTQNNLNTDPWGNDWVYEECNRNATIEGFGVTIHHVVLFSRGPDGVIDSQTGAVEDFLTNGACATDYADWSAVGDDIGEKFSTFDIERNRVEITRQRLASIREGLGAYESSKFMEAQSECLDGLPLSECDFNGDGTYEPGEETGYNFFPNSVNDVLATYYIPDGRAATGGEMTSVGNSLAAMQSLVTMLGLNNSFAESPWGVRLCYESNRTGLTAPPFTAKVEYSATCPTP